MKDAVQQTLLARVYDIASKSPLDFAPKLSKQANCKVYLKREDLQPVHSFKLRGAYNKIAQLSVSEKSKGIIAASAGNHAQGVALSAKKLGLSAMIVMPTTTPAIKIEAVKSYGAEVVLYGDSYSDAYDHCQDLVQKTGRTFVHPFDDPLVIAGQGTIGREILEQQPDVSHIFVPVGGGGLLSGIAQYVKSLRPDVNIIGVEPADSNAMQASLKAGERIKLPHVGIFADGVAVKQVGKLTFEISKSFVDEVITVDTDQICAAIKSVFEDTRSIVEPAGALSVAGLQQYRLPDNAIAVAICSGANMSFERLQFIAERTMLGSGNEAVFAIHMPERPGALRHFCQNVVNGFSISEFNYRLNDRDDAVIFVGIAFSSPDNKQTFISNLSKQDYKFDDLSDDEIAKEHIRHMIGGPAPKGTTELLYEVSFPERPGALNDFLQAVGSDYNISLFHYRGLGADVGKVLLGFETSDKKALENTFEQSAVDFAAISSHATNLFL